MCLLCMEFLIFTHFLVLPHVFQPALVVMISDLKGIGLISCRIEQMIDPVLHYLIFHGHCVTLESCPCSMMIRKQEQL